MMRFFLSFLLFFFLCHSAMAMPCAYQGGDFGTAPLKRGINLSNWWEEGRQTPVSVDELKRLHRMGFDFVRLPISQNWLEQDEQQTKSALSEFRCSVASILNSGMAVIVDMHSTPAAQKEFFSNSEEEIYNRLLQMWRKLAHALRGLPPGKVIFSIYNEPAMEMSAWWPLQGMLVENLRAIFPNRMVVSAGHGGWDLTWVKPYPQKNLIYDFHFYIPLELTHYGAEWHWSRGQNETDGVYPNPDNGWSRAGMAKALVSMLGWRNRFGARLACFEFGIYRPHLDGRTRASWLKDARQALETAHLPWALWEYRGSFGLLNTDGRVDQEMAKALGLAYTR